MMFNTTMRFLLFGLIFVFSFLFSDFTLAASPPPNWACGEDAYQSYARAKDPIAIYAECRDKVWFQRNVNTALSCSPNFIFRGATAAQWKKWSDNQIAKVLNACKGDNVANVDKILAALEVVWSSCLPDRKGVSCVCSVTEDAEGTVCEGFIKDIGPPVISTISSTTAKQAQPINVTGKYLGDKIILTPVSGSPTEISVEPGTLANYLTFEVPDIKDGLYSVISSGLNGSSGEPIKLTVLQGTPFNSTVPLSAPTQGLPTDLGQLISQIFTWSLSILGISVFVMFFYSGFMWLTAAGNTSKIGEAKTHMTNAVFGAILLLSSYLILYTINPDFVKNTVNLPGLGKSGTSTGGGEEGPPPPADALTKHPNQSAVVAAAKADLAARGVSFAGSCGSFAIVKEAALRLSSGGAGLLKKPTGHQCNGFSVDIIAYPDGYIYDILIGSSDDEPIVTTGPNTPTWGPAGCGPAGGNGTCPDRYVKP